MYSIEKLKGFKTKRAKSCYFHKHLWNSMHVRQAGFGLQSALIFKADEINKTAALRCKCIGNRNKDLLHTEDYCHHSRTIGTYHVSTK